MQKQENFLYKTTKLESPFVLPVFESQIGRVAGPPLAYLDNYTYYKVLDIEKW